MMGSSSGSGISLLDLGDLGLGDLGLLVPLWVRRRRRRRNHAAAAMSAARLDTMRLVPTAMSRTSVSENARSSAVVPAASSVGGRSGDGGGDGKGVIPHSSPQDDTAWNAAISSAAKRASLAGTRWQESQSSGRGVSNGDLLKRTMKRVSAARCCP